MVGCAYCDAELNAPDRCDACGRGQPVGWTGGGGAEAAKDPSAVPIDLVVLGFVLLAVGLLCKVIAVSLALSADFSSLFFAWLGDAAVVSAFFLVLVGIYRRVGAASTAS